MLGHNDIHRKPLKNLPATETFIKGLEFQQSELGQKHEQDKRESEITKSHFENLTRSFAENAQKQREDEIARTEQGLALQAEGNEESKKQTALAERSIELSKWAIGIAISGAGIALVSLVFSMWAFFGKC